MRWKNQSVIELDRNKVYVAEIKSSEYTNAVGFKYTNLDVILIGEYNDGKPTDCIYSFILAITKKELNANQEPSKTKDDLPF